MEHCEFLVIGGGPAGGTAAALLARAGRSVAVFEKAAFPRRKVCGEYLGAKNRALLERLELSERFAAEAGPLVRRVGFYAADTAVTADLPVPGAAGYGRAMRRDRLDTALLAQAKKNGARIYQPWSVLRVAESRGGFVCAARHALGGRVEEFQAGSVIAAHGSWEPGPLATQPRHAQGARSDLLAFKAHFRETRLPVDLMPLLAFPGGYGGMVYVDDALVTLSACLRRDTLAACRRAHPALSAGDAVLRHILAHCGPGREALASASREGPWLAAGPIRPAIRRFQYRGVFVAGNAAAEAHPIIAEGIGMAMQSAHLLCALLLAEPETTRAGGVGSAAAAYQRGWRERFALRQGAANIYAGFAMHPALTHFAGRILGTAPWLLRIAAQVSGKGP